MTGQCAFPFAILLPPIFYAFHPISHLYLSSRPSSINSPTSLIVDRQRERRWCTHSLTNVRVNNSNPLELRFLACWINLVRAVRGDLFRLMPLTDKVSTTFMRNSNTSSSTLSLPGISTSPLMRSIILRGRR